MATATTSRYSSHPSHWGSRSSMPSHHSHRTEPIMIPSRSSPRVHNGSSSSPRYTAAPSRRSSNIIHPASPSTYMAEGSPRSSKIYSASVSTPASKYTSKRNSASYSMSPKYASSSSSSNSSSPSPSLKDRRLSSPVPSTKSSRRRSVSFAEAPVLIPQSPGRIRFDKKYNVECLESPRSLVDALNGAVAIPNSSNRSRRDSVSGSVSPPKRSHCALKDLPLKNGITTLPRNLVGREAVEELGYGYECEIDAHNITVFKALSKEQIDCLIALTEQLRRKESKRNSRQTVVVLEAKHHKGEKHHFSPKRSSVCQTSHRGGCTAACFPVEQDCSCADCR